MTKKDYELIAFVISQSTNKFGMIDHNVLVYNMKLALKAENERFNEEKFDNASSW